MAADCIEDALQLVARGLQLRTEDPERLLPELRPGRQQPPPRRRSREVERGRDLIEAQPVGVMKAQNQPIFGPESLERPAECVVEQVAVARADDGVLERRWDRRR